MKYPKILNLGDPSLASLFIGPVLVEEKIDGSQFRVWFDASGKIHFGRKAVDYDDEHPPDRMFVSAIGDAEKHFSKITENLAGFFFTFECLATAQQNGGVAAKLKFFGRSDRRGNRNQKLWTVSFI